MNIFCNWLLITALASLLVPVPAAASHSDGNPEGENFKSRPETLEAEREVEGAEEKPFQRLAARKYLKFGGLLELEATYQKTEEEEDRSDLSLATFAFSTEVTINDHIGGRVVLLYEEDDPDDETVKIDEAVLRLQCPDQFLGQNPAFYGGKQYLPFGTFSSTMITDPLALELGETNETAVLLALEGNRWNLALGVFNGGTDASAQDRIDSLVAALEVRPLENLSFHVSYISDLAESGSELVADSLLYSDSAAGASASVSATLGRFGLTTEVLGALDDFDARLIDLSDLTGNKPLAWYMEASWQAADGLLLTGRYEQARDFQDDIVRYGISGSYDLFSNTVIALEYLHAQPDTDPKSDTLTGQLAFEF